MVNTAEEPEKGRILPGGREGGCFIRWWWWRVTAEDGGSSSSPACFLFTPLRFLSLLLFVCLSFPLFFCSSFIICWWRWQRLGLRTVAGKLGGSCCDGGSAAVLLLCSVFLPLSVSVLLLLSLLLLLLRSLTMVERLSLVVLLGGHGGERGAAAGNPRRMIFF
jgi:hypothetical protein